MEIFIEGNRICYEKYCPEKEFNERIIEIANIIRDYCIENETDNEFILKTVNEMLDYLGNGGKSD